LSIPQYQFFPTIDPLADKNRDLEPEYVAAFSKVSASIRRGPSSRKFRRFDRLKDPVGVIRAYRMARKYEDANSCWLEAAPATIRRE